MSCIQNIVCLGEFCSCGDIVLTGIFSPFTGTAKMFAEFNGAKITESIQIVTAQEISIPNVFNENYTHVIEFYYNNQLINDTSYSIKIVPCIQSSTETPMATYSSIIVTTEEGNTISDERIIGKVVTALIISDASKNTGFSVSGDTITMTDGSEFGEGFTVTIIFQ